MKFEEFKKYKTLIESQDTEILQQFPEAEKVYNWMEETGRIDEGFWSAIWGWLKRNLSPTGRKLHNLANEYEKELTEEYRAEYGKIRYKDLDSRFRSSFAGRMSEDIEDKMTLIAGDDEDYRTLVRALINKKKLKVKKSILQEIAGRVDPDETDPDGYIRRLGDEFDSDYSKADAEYKKALSKTMTESPDTFKKMTEMMRKKVTGSKAWVEMGYSSSSKVQAIVQKLIIYQNNLSKLGTVDFTVKAMETTLKNFVKFIEEGARKIKTSSISMEEAKALFAEAVESFLVKDKPVVFEKISSEALKIAKSRAEKKNAKTGTSATSSSDSSDDAEAEAEEEVTGPLTPEILEPEDVEKTVKAAAKETGEKTPSSEDIVEEINSSVKNYFKDNRDLFLRELVDKVEKFNKLSDSERSTQKSEFDYQLDKENKLTVPTASNMEGIYKNLLLVAGSIVPYYNLEKGKRSKAFYFAIDFMFEIYAIKKETSGEMNTSDLKKLTNNIKEKY